MKYFEISLTTAIPDESWCPDEPMVSNTPESHSLAWVFQQGKKYLGLRDLIIKLNPHGSIPGVPLDFTLGVYGMPIINERIAHILLSIAPGDFELIPCQIEKHEYDDDQYYILNVIKVVDCFDEDRSVEFEKYTQETAPLPIRVNDYVRPVYLKIHKKNIHKEKLFRIARLLSAFIVDEDVKNALEKAHCVGVGFVEVA